MLKTPASKILVAYASRAGSTAGVAQAIGEALMQQGFQVDVRPMQEVDDLTPYQAVVAGSAIRIDKWLPEAFDFLKRHQTELSQKPFAAFLVCLALASGTDHARRTASSYLQSVRDLVTPVSEGFFAGVLDLSRIPERRYRLGFRLFTTVGLFAEGDYRDWNAIHEWANELPVALQV